MFSKSPVHLIRPRINKIFIICENSLRGELFRKSLRACFVKSRVVNHAGCVPVMMVHFVIMIRTKRSRKRQDDTAINLIRRIER